MYDVSIVTTGHASACGPASLKMLLGYYGQDASLDELIEECGVRINGCTGADLLRVGRAHGLDMLAYRMDADELIRQDRPAIIHWRHQHWCVFAGRDENGDVWLCNPSRGRYRIDAGTFGTLYSGVAIYNGAPSDLPVVPDMAAGENIPKGGYFIYGNLIYQAVTAIQKGAEIKPGVNCAVRSLNDMMGG